MTTYEVIWLGNGHARLDRPDDVDAGRAGSSGAG
jgi:hypothetical protein